MKSIIRVMMNNIRMILVLLSVLLGATTALANVVEINETNFPDENFRNWVLVQSYGQDGVLTDEEIANVTIIDVSYKNIQSLKGIEFFTGLTMLGCDYNQLTALDVSKNTVLDELYCFGNMLTELDVSGNAELTYLNCHENQLVALDLSKNVALERLWCSGNQLTSLDVSGCIKLESLKCDRNRLTKLEVLGCAELEEIYCYSNRIKGEAMDELIDGLPIIPSGWGHLPIISLEDEQNVVNKAQVAAARAKGWRPRYKYGSFGVNGWTEYEGCYAPMEYVTFTEGQMATIILPTVPDASKGKYYRLDRCEGNEIIFEQELQPRARVPYIIVPSEDFSIDPSDLDLEGLSNDTVSIDGISFIGTYSREELPDYTGGSFYIDIIDTTPDCRALDKPVVGALRAWLQVNWDDPIDHGGAKSPEEKKQIVLKDNGTGIEGNEELRIKNEELNAVYDLSGRRIDSSLFTLRSSLKKGIYIEDGRKKAVR